MGRDDLAEAISARDPLIEIVRVDARPVHPGFAQFVTDGSADLSEIALVTLLQAVAADPPHGSMGPRRPGGAVRDRSSQRRLGHLRGRRLSPPTPQDVDFLQVSYQAGSESCPADSLMRHSGHEYGHIIRGRMGVTVGFDTYELGPGDSVAFDSTIPHRLFAIGEETVEAIWVVVGRRGDVRLAPGH